MSTKLKLQGAGNIMGYMSHENLVWLAQQAQKHERIVEIGTYLGKSTRALGDNTPGIVYTIDNFQGPQDAIMPAYIRSNTLDLATWALGDLLSRGKVVIVMSDHAEARVPISPDMVFIDGSHQYEDVKRDILKWLPQITKGGLICGDDYTNIIDVRMAVDELLPKAKLARGTGIWYSVL